MRAQWEAAQAGLRVFLEEDGEYANFLESIEKNLARKLRFEYQSRGGSHVESVAFDRFLEVAAQIWHIHAFFQSKLRAIAEPLARGPAGSVEEKCNSFVEILADMLSLLRMQYGQLFCRREATQAAFDAALANNIREWDGKVLEKYLAKQQLTADKLVDRPLQRFEELVEFVEALSKTLSEDGIDGALSNDSDMGTEEKLNYAPQLMHIVQETKHYIHLVKANAREEKELISLQSCFYGDGAEAFHDLSDNKLLLHGEVFLSQSDRSGADSETATSITGSFSQPEDLYLHCFQDGTTRIDFWFDQVWKAIENAQVETRRTEREKRERKEMEEEEQSMRVERKKRKLQTVSDKDESAVDATLNSSSNASPAGSNNSKPDDKTDEEYGELDKSTSSIVVAEELIAALPVSKKSRRLSDKPKPISAAASAEKDTCTSSIVSPAVTTPKRRWLKRKSEDPDDTALIPTQPSSSIPTDETTSEIDTLQLPANEAAAEEPRTQEVRIILTGIEPTAAIRKKIDSIAGALYEEDIEKATHILAPKNQLKRTVKLLCGISRSSHVLDVRWLDESARVGAPV
ncbi:hypothetical protein PInf_019458 [Phytophthora infestans]|nr:hypothetical protein PInf_019458 [Phytophthora infestans]